MTYRYTLPYPPLVNNMYTSLIIKGRVTRVKSKRGRGYLVDAQTAMLQSKRPAVLLSGPVAVRLTSYRPQKRGDIDGILKAVLDALKGMVYCDDDQIVILRVVRRDDKLNPRVEVAVRAISEQAVLL